MPCYLVEIPEINQVIRICYDPPSSDMPSDPVDTLYESRVYVGTSPGDELLSGLSNSEDLIGFVSINAIDFEQSSQQPQSEDIEGQDDYLYGLASISGNTDFYSSIESASDLIALSDDIAIVDLDVYSDSL